MQPIDLWQAGVATGALFFCVAWFFRALMRGDLVLGSTHKELQQNYTKLADEFKAATIKQEALAAEERAVLIARIDAQARRLDVLMDKLPAFKDDQ